MPFFNPRRLSLWGVLMLALPTASFGAAADQPQLPEALDPSQATRGQLIYQRFCAACHGTAGKGDGQLAAGLRSRPTDLTRMAERNGGVFAYDKVSRAIDGRDSVRMHGSADMPVWGEVFAKTRGTDAPDPDEAVARISHYVWSIQKPAAR
jgi:mono/diheme cytochrome c family protein